jgi:glycerophosphoryl diester phosphodiesterase
VILFAIILPSLALIILSHANFSSLPPPELPPGYHRFANKTPRVFSHRGSTKLFPQNTLFAFQNSVALGADVLDMDVRLTKDGEVVMVHDESLYKVTGQNVLVQDLTLAELLQFDFGFTFTPNEGKSFPYRGLGIKVMTLRQALTELPSNALLNIELKIPGPGFIGTGGLLPDKVCELLTEFKATKRAIVASFSDMAWYRFRSRCPEVPTAAGPLTMLQFLFFATITLGEVPLPRLLVPFSALQPPQVVTTQSVVEAAHRINVGVHVWTVDAPADIDDLTKINVDGIMSDRLDVLLESVGNRGRGIITEDVFDRIGTGKACDAQLQDKVFRDMVRAGCQGLFASTTVVV